MIKVLLLTAFLVGCSQANGDDTAILQTISNDAQSYGVRDVYLEDGTHCVLIYQNGISCNWSANKHPELIVKSTQ